MKKILILVLLLVGISNSSFAEQSIYCKFYYIKGIDGFDGNQATFYSFWEKVPWFNVNFKSNNKEDWYVENIFADKEFPREIENTYNFEVDALIKIDKFKKKDLTFAEEDFVRNLAKRYNTSPDDIFSIIKSMKQNQLGGVIVNGLEKLEYIQNWYKRLDDIDFSNSQLKEQLNSLLSDVSSDGDYVTIKSSSQFTELKIISKINYSEIIKDVSESAMELQVSIKNDPFIIFDTICSSNSVSSSNSKSNDFKEQLKELKSLFEEDLITEDEYKKKRKEILDKM